MDLVRFLSSKCNRHSKFTQRKQQFYGLRIIMQVSLSYVACLIMYKAPPLTVFTLVKIKKNFKKMLKLIKRTAVQVLYPQRDTSVFLNVHLLLNSKRDMLTPLNEGGDLWNLTKIVERFQEVVNLLYKKLWILQIIIKALECSHRTNAITSWLKEDNFLHP